MSVPLPVSVRRRLGRAPGLPGAHLDLDLLHARDAPTAREAMLCKVAFDAGDWLVNASVKLTCESAIVRSRMSPSVTMSCCASGSFTARSASSTAS